MAAESLGLGGVYIGGLRNNIDAVTELLKLPQHVLPLFGLCLGWPDDNPEVKPRMPSAMLVHENHYQPLDDAVLAEYDEQIAQYYLSRGAIRVAIPGATISVGLLLKRAVRLFCNICISRDGLRADCV